MKTVERAAHLRTTLQSTEYWGAMAGVELCKFCPRWADAVIAWAENRKWISVCQMHVEVGRSWLLCVRGMVG